MKTQSIIRPQLYLQIHLINYELINDDQGSIIEHGRFQSLAWSLKAGQFALNEDILSSLQRPMARVSRYSAIQVDRKCPSPHLRKPMDMSISGFPTMPPPLTQDFVFDFKHVYPLHQKHHLYTCGEVCEVLFRFESWSSLKY